VPVTGPVAAISIGLPHPSGSVTPMQVTEEDGGRLNAFAREPRMVVVEAGERDGRGNRTLLIAGLVLVLAMVAVAAGIS
jgi:hypothetical protein